MIACLRTTTNAGFTTQIFAPYAGKTWVTTSDIYYLDGDLVPSGNYTIITRQGLHYLRNEQGKDFKFSVNKTFCEDDYVVVPPPPTATARQQQAQLQNAAQTLLTQAQ